MKKILTIAPHPDDETLGCGGTLLRHHFEGDECHWLIMTKLDKSIGYDEYQIKQRDKEISTVSKMYSFKTVSQLDFITTMMDTYALSEIIKKVSKIINKIKPDTIYLPYYNDVHSDHRITYDAVISSTKSFRASYIKKIVAYETLSETEFALGNSKDTFDPNLFINVSKYLNKKIKIMRIYKSELQKHPNPRSIENIKALAIHRGSTIGVSAAESFLILRHIL